MKNIRILLCSLIGLFGVLTSNAAWADRGRFGVGVYIGAPYPYGFYRPYYYPYYPPVVVAPPPVVIAPAQAPIYVEQESPQQAPQQPAASQSSSYWYHCDKPEGYYPYVKTCPAGWKAVEPTPAAPAAPPTTR